MFVDKIWILSYSPLKPICSFFWLNSIYRSLWKICVDINSVKLMLGGLKFLWWSRIYILFVFFFSKTEFGSCCPFQSTLYSTKHLDLYNNLLYQIFFFSNKENKPLFLRSIFAVRKKCKLQHINCSCYRCSFIFCFTKKQQINTS